MRISFSKKRAITFGELGTIVGYTNGAWYGDLFFGGRRRSDDLIPPLRRFVNDEIFRSWETLTLNGWQLDKIEVLDAENAARILRRTMKPYMLIQHRRRGIWMEAMSYPCPNPDNTVTIMTRTVPEESGTLQEFDATEFDPISFQATNIPAENPVPR